MNTPVFGYLRRSSKSQDGNDGFDRQQAAIEAFCITKGFAVVRWFQEDAVSGTVEVCDRAQFSEMLLLAGPATATTIIVERADRLARDLMVSELACNEARKAGVVIYEAASGTNLTDSSDPTRVLIRQVLGALSEWNKNIMVSRLRAARQRKRELTGRCEGRRGFGYRCIEDAETVEMIMGFRRAGFSFRKIVKELIFRKRQTPVGEGRWQISSVFYIFERTTEKRRSEKRPEHTRKLLDGLPLT